MRILVVRTNALGDAILATPLLRALADHFPDSEIHFVTRPAFAPLFDGLPFLRRVWPWDPGQRAGVGPRAMAAELRRSGSFDLAVDLQNSAATFLLVAALRPKRKLRLVKRKGMKAVLASLFGEGPILDERPNAALYLDVLAPLGVFPAPRSSDDRSFPPLRDPATGLDLRPAVRIDPDALAWVDAQLVEVEGAPIVGIAPGGRWAPKRWDPLRFAEVGDALAEAGARVLLVGGPGDRREIEAVRHALAAKALAETTEWSIPALAAGLSRARILVTCDSAPNHLAQAVGTPVVTVFGPTSQRRWGPLPGAGVAVALPIACAPCSNFGRRPCPLGHHACMKDLGAAPVIIAALAALRDDRLGGSARARQAWSHERLDLAIQVARSRRVVRR